MEQNEITARGGVFTAVAKRDAQGDYTLQILNTEQGTSHYFTMRNAELFRRFLGSLFHTVQDGYELLPVISE